MFEKFVPMFERVLRSSEVPYEDCRILEPRRDKTTTIPFVAPAQPDHVRAANLFSLRDRNLRVITKLSSIVLSPRKHPDDDEGTGGKRGCFDGRPFGMNEFGDDPQVPITQYEGGSWHVEGEPQECIVATGLYYFDNENITESTLHFRVGMTDCFEMEHEQNDFEGTYERYGWRNDDMMEQPIGSIRCDEGRLVAFPNTMQHRVAPFKATDPSKPAHRKILAFFLVDPAVPVMSTNEVPYQNAAWLERLLLRLITKSTGLPNIPPELVRLIVLRVRGVFNMEQAVKNRAALMEIRKSGDHLGDTFEQECSLCEH